MFHQQSSSSSSANQKNKADEISHIKEQKRVFSRSQSQKMNMRTDTDIFIISYVYIERGISKRDLTCLALNRAL